MEKPDTLGLQSPGCRYADFFRRSGEPEPGARRRVHADATIMQGAAYCDFRYRMKE